MGIGKNPRGFVVFTQLPSLHQWRVQQGCWLRSYERHNKKSAKQSQDLLFVFIVTIISHEPYLFIKKFSRNMDTPNILSYYHTALDYSMESYFSKNLKHEPDKKCIEPYIDFIHQCQLEDDLNTYDFDTYEIKYFSSITEFTNEYVKTKEVDEKVMAGIVSLTKKMEDAFKELSEVVPTEKLEEGQEPTPLKSIRFLDEKKPIFQYPGGRDFDSYEYAQNAMGYLRAINSLYREISNKSNISTLFKDVTDNVENTFTSIVGFNMSFTVDIVLRVMREQGNPLKNEKVLEAFSQIWKSRISALFFNDNVYYILGLPDELILNQNYQVGHMQIPSVVFGDEAFWFVNGTYFPPSFGKPIEELTKEDVLAIKNIEMRRTFFEKFGQVELIKKLGAEPFDKAKDEYGNPMTLYKTDVDEVVGDSLYYVEVVCPSTDHVYTIPVPPMTDVREAVAWTFNRTKDGYQPKIQT